MKRRLITLAATAILLAPQGFAAGNWVKSVDAATKAARDKKQLILVDMFAEWCGWCHRFERDVFPSMVFQNATDDMVLLRLDTEDGKEGTQFARKYGVTSLPTFLVLAPDLSIAGVIRGYAPPNDFVRTLKETRSRYDAFMTRVKNESKIANDPAQRLDLAKEYATRAAYDKAEPRLRKLTTDKKIPVPIRDEAYYQLAIIYTMQNKPDDGLKTIRQLTALSKSGESVERARILAGQIYMQQGNLLGAANEFRSFKQTFPNSPLVRNVDMVLPDIERRLASGN